MQMSGIIRALMNYWIFKCNPERYLLEDRLADPEPSTTWRISRYRDRVQADDVAFIWETGSHRRIRATIRVDSSPQDMPELESELRFQTVPDTKIDCRVYATYLRRDLRIPATELRVVAGLEGLSVFHGYQQTTVFRVTSEEAAVLLRVIG